QPGRELAAGVDVECAEARAPVRPQFLENIGVCIHRLVSIVVDDTHDVHEKPRILLRERGPRLFELFGFGGVEELFDDGGAVGHNPIPYGSRGRLSSSYGAYRWPEETRWRLSSRRSCSFPMAPVIAGQ